MITDNFWRNLKKVINVAEFADTKLDSQPGRYAAKAMIEEKLNQALRENTVAHWLDKLDQLRIPCAPVNNFEQVLTDEQVQHRNMVVELKHPSGKATHGPGNPIKLSRTNEESFSPAPLLAQDAEDIFGKLLKLDDDKIADLRKRGVIV